MILVTGGTGFVGSYVVRRLASRGVPVKVLMRGKDAAGDKDAGMRRERLDRGSVTLVEGDVTKPDTLDAALQGVDTVIHLVAVIRENKARGITYERVNVQGTKNLVDAAKRAGVKAFVHMGALGAQDSPDLKYVYSKWLAEEYVRKSGVPYSILEPSIIFGPEDEFINQLADLVKMAPITPVVGDGTFRFQPIHVEDVAHCLDKMAHEEALRGKTVQVGGPDFVSYEKMIDEIIAVLNAKRLKIHMPLALMRPVVSVMELTLPRPPVTRNQLQQLGAGDNITEKDAVEKHFQFRPRPLHGNIDYVRHGSWLDAYKRLFNAAPIGATTPKTGSA